jgi:ABC-type transport system involved in cytochrome c biogenesis permease component
VLAAAGWGVAVVSTFLAALVARAGGRNVLFVLVCFPLMLPLLLASIDATVAAAARVPRNLARVILAYDGAATCGAYLLAGAAWEE